MISRLLSILVLALASFSLHAQEKGDGKLRIVVFGAHPDDAEYKTAGVAVKCCIRLHRDPEK